jgi:predicted dehydrogenase
VSAPRIGIVGARRERQGLGPFVVRDLVRLGASVPAFVTTRAASRDTAQAELAANPGIDARGYLSTEAMLAAESLDALAILSPSASHRTHLDAALAAGLPVLCEKPLVWSDGDLGAESRDVVAAFGAAGLLLWENCQWPYTLAAYERLFPGALERPPERFWMTMQPASAGLQGLADSLPHTLSLLQSVTPGEDARLEDIGFRITEPENGDLAVSFRYVTRDHTTRVRVDLVPSATSPRAAAYALDDRRADRCVRGDDYRLSFENEDGRAATLDDPMTCLLTDFVAALTGAGPRVQHPDIGVRMTLFGQLVDACRSWERSEARKATQ